jgi:hypothetical protein
MANSLSSELLADSPGLTTDQARNIRAEPAGMTAAHEET